jgi:hypothetical protein
VATSTTREKRKKRKIASVKIGKKETSHLEKNRSTWIDSLTQKRELIKKTQTGKPKDIEESRSIKRRKEKKFECFIEIDRKKVHRFNCKKLKIKFCN